MYYLNSDLSKVYVRFYYRNFSVGKPGCSHVGLGINGLHTVKVLRRNKIRSDLVPVWEANASDIIEDLKNHPDTTHVVIEAPYVNSDCMSNLIRRFPNMLFTCRCHSQVGFLQVEAGAIKLIRDYLRISEQEFNFFLSVNSDKLGHFIQQAYNHKTVYLPNLYDEERIRLKPYKQITNVVKAGSFGAIRLQKNHITAAAAALTLAKLHRWDLKFYMSVNREEHGVGVLQAIRNLLNNVPGVEFVEVPWQSWPQFRQQVGDLDIHFQLSMSETFNITVADAIAEGVPSVVGEAIDWVPKNWSCNIDDVYEAASTAYKLLHDPHAPQRGITALQNHVKNSTSTWKNYLSGNYVWLNHFDN